MTNAVSTANGQELVIDLVAVIVANRDYLSEIDGAIGDGDHGINMAKGFSICEQNIRGKSLTLAQAFDALSDALMEGIGGSMGPLYGSIFMGMADSIRASSELNAQQFADMLRSGLSTLQEISSAQLGDKCLMDTLIPAVEAFEKALQAKKSFADCLHDMKQAAAVGRDSTIDLVAKIGRASRLGERSKGVLDAGATSCCLLLNQLADSVQQRL